MTIRMHIYNYYINIIYIVIHFFFKLIVASHIHIKLRDETQFKCNVLFYFNVGSVVRLCTHAPRVSLLLLSVFDFRRKLITEESLEGGNKKGVG